MILGKIWKAIAAQFNKLGNWFSGYDPIAQMQYEYDRSVDQLREGREGLAQYRALVERVTRQVDGQRKQVATIEAKIKAYLSAGDRDTAAKLALDLKRAREDQAENERQLALHEQAYSNNLLKIKHAVEKLEDVKHKITKYDADLKMSRAEAEMSQLATQFNFNVTTDFGQAEQIMQDQIDKNRARRARRRRSFRRGRRGRQARDRRREDDGRGRTQGVREGDGTRHPRGRSVHQATWTRDQEPGSLAGNLNGQGPKPLDEPR